MIGFECLYQNQCRMDFQEIDQTFGCVLRSNENLFTGEHLEGVLTFAVHGLTMLI